MFRGFYSQIHMLYWSMKFNRFLFSRDAKFLRFIITAEIVFGLFGGFFVASQMNNLLLMLHFCNSTNPVFLWIGFSILKGETNPNVIQQAPCWSKFWCKIKCLRALKTIYRRSASVFLWGTEQKSLYSGSLLDLRNHKTKQRVQLGKHLSAKWTLTRLDYLYRLTALVVLCQRHQSAIFYLQKLSISLGSFQLQGEGNKSSAPQGHSPLCCPCPDFL